MDAVATERGLRILGEEATSGISGMANVARRSWTGDDNVNSE